MERELKGVPRRGPIVRGNMTGAKGSEVGGETHLREKRLLPPSTEGWNFPGTPSVQGGAHPSQGTSALGLGLLQPATNLICS